jgi:hypothetical protein
VADEIEIKCIKKSDRADAHERIRSVGGVNAQGQRWKLSENDAIAGIIEGKWRFWTQGGGKKVWVVIAKSAARNEYLKTEADGIIPDNLLALPECP